MRKAGGSAELITNISTLQRLDLLVVPATANPPFGTVRMYQNTVTGYLTAIDYMGNNVFPPGSVAPGTDIETLAAGTVRSGPWGDRIRVREVVSGVAGSPTGVTYTINGVFKI